MPQADTCLEAYVTEYLWKHIKEIRPLTDVQTGEFSV